LVLLGGADYLSAFETNQLQALARSKQWTQSRRPQQSWMT
jgi:hypothetical protein